MYIFTMHSFFCEHLRRSTNDNFVSSEFTCHSLFWNFFSLENMSVKWYLLSHLASVPLLLTAFISADDATSNQPLPSNTKFISTTWISVLLIPGNFTLIAGSKMVLMRWQTQLLVTNLSAIFVAFWNFLLQKCLKDHCAFPSKFFRGRD